MFIPLPPSILFMPPAARNMRRSMRRFPGASPGVDLKALRETIRPFIETNLFAPSMTTETDS